MSLLDRIDIARDKLQMEKDRKAIERRDSRIKYANDMLASGEISKELADKWIQRANEEYTNPKGNLLERAGKVIADKMIQAGDNIAASQREENGGKSYWQNVAEGIRDLPREDIVVNIPESRINLDAIPQSTINTDALNQPISFNLARLTHFPPDDRGYRRKKKKKRKPRS